MRTSSFLAAALTFASLAACNSSSQPAVEAAASPQSGDVKAQVEEAVRKHLARRSDLDMSAMDMTVQNVEVSGETAEATVGFQVKDTPEAGMSMQYRLVREGGEWVVQPNAAATHAPGGAQPPPAQGLPPGHPPAGGAPPQSTEPLPPGHPPVAQ